jgi:hypothetical protein
VQLSEAVAVGCAATRETQSNRSGKDYQQTKGACTTDGSSWAVKDENGNDQLSDGNDNRE